MFAPRADQIFAMSRHQNAGRVPEAPATMSACTE